VAVGLAPAAARPDGESVIPESLGRLLPGGVESELISRTRERTGALAVELGGAALTPSAGSFFS